MADAERVREAANAIRAIPGHGGVNASTRVVRLVGRHRPYITPAPGGGWWRAGEGVAGCCGSAELHPSP